jgi:arylsulfatase
MPRTILALALALAAGSSLTSCGTEPPGPNYVFITLDTTRADHLGLYGYFRDTTPELDALAQESIVFEHCIVPMAVTLPSHTSLLTGTYPSEHGILGNLTKDGRRYVPAESPAPFAEFCRDAGYETGAFVSAAPLKRDSGINAGYGVFEQPEKTERKAQVTTDAALAWLEGLGHRRFHLWVHYFDAHWPYAAPPPFADRFRTDAGLEAWIAEREIPDTGVRALTGEHEDARAAINAYDAEIAYQDAELGRLLAALRARPDWDQTVVVVVGDHGEGLCQRGETAHGGTWGEQLHVPLIVRAPGERPRREAQTLSMVDVVPTVLGLAPAAKPSSFSAQSSGRDVLASKHAPRPALSQDSVRHGGQEGYHHALTTDRWKYVRTEDEDGEVRELLFDLVADPFELENVAATHAAALTSLRAALASELELQRSRGEAFRGGRVPATRAMDSSTYDELRALGYVGGEDDGE